MNKEKIYDILSRNEYLISATLLDNGCSITFPTMGTTIFQFSEDGIKTIYNGTENTVKCPRYMQRIMLAQYLVQSCATIGYNIEFVNFSINDVEVDFNEFFGYCAPANITQEELEKENALSSIIESMNVYTREDIMKLASEYKIEDEELKKVLNIC